LFPRFNQKEEKSNALGYSNQLFAQSESVTNSRQHCMDGSVREKEEEEEEEKKGKEDEENERR